MQSMYGSDFDPQFNALTTLPALYDLELRHWTDAAALQLPAADPASLQFVHGGMRGDRAITYWARAIGAARAGNLAQARMDREQIAAIQKEFVDQKKTEYAEAVGQDYEEASAWIAHAEGKNDEAIASLRALADKNDQLGNEPGGIPAREMLADLLLEARRPEQALAEYQTDLKFNPNRFNGLYGAARAAEEAGQHSEASEYYTMLLKVCDGGSSTRPELNRAKELLAKK
jgi:tetratricopeptide (TPR) repeat protein